ncbi:MAG TPA: response regulator [Pseudomonadota bacterium]|nr:response regulator [Pseudomonadota bacterium]
MSIRTIVADDDPAILDLVTKDLESMGLEVMRADNGVMLIELVANQGPFDLIITDISMPWMSGLQVAMSARNAGVRTPVIVMTGLRDDDLMRQVGNLGEQTVLLRKPFDLAELHGALGLLLPKVRLPS